MVEPVRHRQTKEAETDMFDLQPPRHISTLHKADERACAGMSGAGEGSAPLGPDRLRLVI